MTVESNDSHLDDNQSSASVEDDRFIPIRARTLGDAIARDTDRFGDEAVQLGLIAHSLKWVCDLEASAFERNLVDRYEPFNPDRDTIDETPLEEEVAIDSKASELEEWLGYLFGKANFRQLSEAEIEAAVNAASLHGLRVRLRPEVLDSLTVWARGRYPSCARRRTLRHPIRGVERDYEMYRRLIVAARLVDDPHLQIKLFKDIPVPDLEALLPHAEVQMSLVDQLKVFGGGAGVLGSTAMKAFTVFASVIYWTKLFWIVAIGASVLLFRSFFGYRTARTIRDSQRIQQLYFQKLASNLGAIHLVLSKVREEEAKEAILAYTICRSRQTAIASAADLQEAVEAYLRERFELVCRFDVDDAIESMDRLDLWSDRDRFEVLAPEPALERIQKHWQERRSLEYHLDYARMKAAEPRSTPPSHDSK
ncbi:MAG: DUF3754 domain-containing protein [Phycisphaerales bacterium]